ncbi:MAG: hypothetical protein GW938_07955 [Leptospira sp.]|nr:hypothetical protein [Leptospira sp.]NCS93167.1 hypothetical protein [Leptospira sp.]
MNQSVDHKNFSELLELVYAPLPKLKQIEKTIEMVHPATISTEIEKNVGFAYMMDYYFRIIDQNLVKSILQNPIFSHQALTELFYCQITSIHKAKLLKRPIPELISSYWKLLSKAQFAILLKDSIHRTYNLEPAKDLLSKIELVHIKMLTGSGGVSANRMLNLFKSFGSDIKKVFSEDMNIYDFAFNLAVEESDDAFLAFLEEYTILFVQLRIVSSFTTEMESLIQKKGERLDYSEIHQFFSHIPLDAIELTLELFVEKNWVKKSESDLILDSYLAKK